MSEESCFRPVPGISAEYRVFGNHGYDYSHWKRRIFDKHVSRGSQETVRRWSENRVNALQEENEHLRKLLKQNQSQLASAKNVPRYLHHPFLWRVNRFLRHWFGSIINGASRSSNHK